MVSIKDIFRANICSFCQNIYEYDSIDDEEFIKELKYFFKEEDLQECLKLNTAEIAYNIEKIDIICKETTWQKLNYEVNEELLYYCKRAFLKTIYVDKTIHVEAFTDNLKSELARKY